MRKRYKCWRYELNLGPIGHKSDTLASRAIRTLQTLHYFLIYYCNFNVLKICQSRAMIDILCQDEGFELTYYIETLHVPYCRR